MHVLLLHAVAFAFAATGCLSGPLSWLSQEQRDTSIDSMTYAYSTIEEFSKPVLDATMLSRQIYLMRLSVALQGTQTPILKRRMDAVKELKDLATHCRNNSNQSTTLWLKNSTFRKLLFEQRR